MSTRRRWRRAWLRFYKCNNWEVRLFTQVQYKITTKKKDGRHAIERGVGGVWSKLQAWNLFVEEISVAALLDTDLLITGNCDALFSLMQSKEVQAAGAMRGSLRTPSDQMPEHWSFLQGDKHLDEWERKVTGGINGGVMMLKPSKSTYADMIKKLENDYVVVNPAGAEQDFESWYFGRKKRVWLLLQGF